MEDSRDKKNEYEVAIRLKKEGQEGHWKERVKSISNQTSHSIRGKKVKREKLRWGGEGGQDAVKTREK